MIKELQYKGYATEPSDYECPDGQLATSLNLINEDSQLKPVFQPSELAELPSGYKVVYIHDTNTFTHYILLNTSTNKLYWIDESIITDGAVKPVSSATIETELAQTSPSRELYSFGSTEIYNVNSMGNILIVLTSDGMHYMLWKGTAEGYLYLGTHLPELTMSFGLQGEMVRSDMFNFELAEQVSMGDSTSVKLSDNNKRVVTSNILAKVNKFIAEESVSKGRFMFPFLVRYAYRLYNGTLTMHSSPVLMVCSSDVTPQVPIVNNSEAIFKTIFGMVEAMVHKLDYAVINSSEVEELKKWKDIVQSVDVFVSAPIYSYKQSGEIERFENFGATTEVSYLLDSISICKHTNAQSSVDAAYKNYQVSTFEMLERNTFGSSSSSLTRAILPAKTDKEITDEIRDTSNFYLLKSINIEDLKTDRTVIEVDKGYLENLVNREAMTDDYDSHDMIMPRKAMIYNSRLHLTDITKILTDGLNIGAITCYTNGGVTQSNGSDTALYDVWFFIKENGREIVVKGGGSTLAVDHRFIYLYHPHPGCYKAVFKSSVDTKPYAIPMKRHAFLNGSVGFTGWNPTYDIAFGTPQSSSEGNRSIQLPNKIYVSNADTPFVFAASNIISVGSGKVIGVSSAAKALSQGQFGQFPLYAFTTEGVWALEVSSAGSYFARQPITRDVCINTDSITQIDSSVLFATDRGIMLISGSQTQCITDNIFSEAPFNVLDLPGIDQLHTKLGHSADACLPMKPFLGFLAGCQMVYDYVHQRIFVYNPTKENVTPKYTYAYVFSLKSKMWGMVFTNLASTINAYPEALAMTHDNKLVSFSETDEQVCKGLYITRPLKLEAADVHKTISALIQRGHFQRGDVGTVLYGSRDLFSWHLVWSSKDHYLRGFRGTPYKYFRIAGLATLTDGKSIFGASVNFEPRHTNQLR